MARTREQIEHEQDVKIRAAWRCEECHAEHGRPHPQAPSRRVFLLVIAERAVCQLCAPEEEA